MATKSEQLGEVLESAGYESGRQYAPSTAGVPAVGAISTIFNPNTTVGRTGTTIKDYAQAASEGKYSSPQRVGDYMVDPVSNTTTLVSNSPTDIVNRYVTSSAKGLQGMSLSDWMNVASTGIMAWKGLPTNNSDNMVETIGTTAVGQLLSKNPATSALWTAGNVLNAVNEIKASYFDDYINQDFNYDLAGDFEKNEDGTTTFRPNYIKMSGAGSESGSAVIDSQNTDNTSVEMTGDNQFVFHVSPVFAESENYKSLLNTIKDNYSSMTMDEANEVVDKDTGATRLDTINSVLKAAESNYLYNASVVKDVKAKAPTASDESLNMAVEVSKIGYLSDDQLEDVTVSVYNTGNELVEVNAKTYLDGIAEMDKLGRENYMLSLGNRIADPNISDNEKAVLYAQSMALYAASSGDNDAYKGMYQKGFWDEVGSAREIFTGITWNTYLGNQELTTFETNEFAAGALNLGTTFGSIKALTGLTNLTEKGLRAITPKISSWAGESLSGAAASMDESASTIKNLANIAGKSGTQIGYQIAADAIYDTAKLVPYALTGTIDDYDFLKELRSDFAMDMLVTYGPGQFVSSMESPKFEQRVLVEDAKTGEQKFVRYKDYKSNDDYKILTDSLGHREVQSVEVTGEEIAKRRAEVIDKLTDSKVGLRVQELFFDKNSAMGKLAVQARRWGNKYQYQKMLRFANDIRQVTADTLREYMSNSRVSEHWDKLSEVLTTAAPTLKQFTQKDWDYIKATINEYRFLGKNEGDANAEKLIKEFYKAGKTGVSAERRAQLNEIISAMQTVASDILDFYVEKGLMTQKAVDELRSAPGYDNGMYLPMYVAQKGGVGGAISQDRQLYKRVRDGSALIALKDLDNPMNSLARYINNAMRAVAVNDRALAVQEAATIAGTGIHVIDDTGNSLREIKNLKSMNDGFKKVFNGIRTQVHSDLPSFTDWQKNNGDMILRSRALKTAERLSSLQKEAKQLNKDLRRARRDIGSTPEEKDGLREKIANNKQQQLQVVDDIKRYAKTLMQRAQKAHKGSDIKLDVKGYIDVQLTNGLKAALKAENMVGEVQKVLNDAVEHANPWVDREVVIQRRAEAAAYEYRKKVASDIQAQKKKETGKKLSMEKLNSLTDKVMDRVMNIITGERPAEVTFIDDEGVPTKLLDNHGQGNTIRYMLNGEEQRMVLSGDGAEELVAEFYAPEFIAPSTTGQKIRNRLRNVANAIAQGKRYLTTSANALRAPMNLARDWTRGIVTTGGQIVLSPNKFFNELIENGNYTDGEITKIRNGLMLARGAVDESTLNASLSTPYRNRDKEMVRAMAEPDGNAFIKFVYDLKAHPIRTLAETPQDFAEKYTRKRAMDTAYYKEIADAQSRGLSVDEAIKSATESAYFAGRESTVNFFRRGQLIGNIAQQVPYLTQRFSSIESFKYAYLNDPIGVSRSLKTTVSAYATLIAIALSNEESRKKYFLLSEYDRSNNILIPIDNGMIMTIPLDETIAAFLTPYRRMIESLNGLDPEAFYLCFAEGLEALSPADLSGFSEGDGFNVVRGLEKLGAEFIPTWAQPFVEMATGRDLYYGSNLRIDSDYTGMTQNNWTPTAGELTTSGKNSKTLALVADHTGIPQWILQNFLSEYGGSIGEYVLNSVDKISGATAEAQGGRDWSDTIFKAFTGSDSDQASSAFWDAINSLKTEKKKVQNEIKTITSKIEGSSYNAKAELMSERQKKISEYGLRVTDVLNQYLSAFEITGGLSKKQANQAWYLLKLYDESSNSDLYLPNSTGDYFTDKAAAYNSKQATSLAARSGFDTIVRSPVNDFYDTYAEQAFKNTAYGDAYEYIANIEDILQSSNLTRSNMWKYYYSTVNDSSTKAQKKQAKAEWNKQVVKALAPYIQEVGVDNALDQRKVVDYLDEVIFVDNLYETKEYLKSIFKE